MTVNITYLRNAASPLNVTNAVVSGTPGTASQINTGDPNTVGLIIKGNTYVPTPYTPDQISNLFAWYKADAIVGLSDTNPVGTWTDSSGNGRNLSASGGNRPIYRTNQVNSLPALTFNDTGTQSMTVSATIAAATQVTAFFVALRTAAINNGVSPVLMADNAGAGYFVGIQNFQTVNPRAWMSNGTAIRSTQVAGLVDPSYYILTAQFNGASSFMRRNATQILTGNANTTGSMATLKISGDSSASQNWGGAMAEVIIFTKLLSSAEYQGIESYLSTKYNITIAGSVAQTSDLQEWQNSNGTVLTKVDATGGITAPSATTTGAVTGATVVATGGLGCNGKAAQTAYASGGALNAYATGAFGLDSDANMQALYTLVVNMRAALVANGIMS